MWIHKMEKGQSWVGKMLSSVGLSSLRSFISRGGFDGELIRLMPPRRSLGDLQSQNQESGNRAIILEVLK